jgi:hypothetical protein
MRNGIESMDADGRDGLVAVERRYLVGPLGASVIRFLMSSSKTQIQIKRASLRIQEQSLKHESRRRVATVR